MLMKRLFSLCLMLFLIPGIALAQNADDLEKANGFFKDRENISSFNQAMEIYEHYYFKHKPGFDKAMFLSRAYYYFGERYKDGNRRKALSSFSLGAKWAKFALSLKNDDFDAIFYYNLCKLRAGGLKTQIGALDALKNGRKDFEELLVKYPDNPFLKRALGKLYREAPDWPVGFRDLDKSEKLLFDALQKQPTNIEIAIEYVRTLIANQQYKEARTLIIKIDSMKAEKGWEVEAAHFKTYAKVLLSKIRGKF